MLADRHCVRGVNLMDTLDVWVLADRHCVRGVNLMDTLDRLLVCIPCQFCLDDLVLFTCLMDPPTRILQ